MHAQQGHTLLARQGLSYLPSFNKTNAYASHSIFFLFTSHPSLQYLLFLEGLQYLSIVSEQLDAIIKEIIHNLRKDTDIHYLANC